MIVDGFIDVLEQGLEKPGQMVVRPLFITIIRIQWLNVKNSP